MRSKIIPIITILVMVVSSFGAVSSNINENNFSDCNCENTVDNDGDFDKMCGLLDNFSIHHDPELGETFVGNPPSSVDWTSRNFDGKTGDWMTSIRNQGGCGSCWAFATIGVIEAMVNIKNKDPALDLDLSEQYMVSCGDYDIYRMNGCNGAQMCRPFWESGLNYVDWAVFFDAIPEDCFDYSASNENCNNKCDDYYTKKVQVTKCGWIDTFLGNKDSMKNALDQKGPLVTRMEVYSNFKSYEPNDFPNGVYKKGDNPGALLGGHAVVIVGYDDSLNCWKCKNSWGSSWGDNGYFKIGYDECSINSDVMYIEVDDYVDPAEATVEFELYKIKLDGNTDPIEGWPDTSSADWNFEVKVGNKGRTSRLEDNHNTYTRVSSFYYLTDDTTLDITVKLEDIDDGPLTSDDIADIGGKDSNGNNLHGSEPYDDAGECSWSSFPRAAYFKTTLDRTKANLLDALTGDKITDASEGSWSGYKASGEFDGGSGDENDAEIWFNIHYKKLMPDLDASCDPNPLSWSGVDQIDTRDGTITVTNIGASGSLLSWKVKSHPSWVSCSKTIGRDIGKDGTDSFTITAHSSPMPGELLSGKIRIENLQDSNDYKEFDIDIKTKKGKDRSFPFDLLELFKTRLPWLFYFFVNLPNLQK